MSNLNRTALRIVAICALAAVFSAAGGAQRPSDSREPERAIDGRVTPLGRQIPGDPRQRPPAPAKSREQPQTPTETAAAAVQRAVAAHGGPGAIRAVQDSVSEGTLTRFSRNGPSRTFEVRVVRKGEDKILRTIRQGELEWRHGSDGAENWDSFGGFSTTAAGPVRSFIESETARSIRNLLEHEPRGAMLRDLGVRGNGDREVEVENPDGRATRYSIDGESSRVTRMEFVTGESRSALGGKPVPNTETYLFSDFRAVRGAQTPFRIERFVNGVKTEETQFDSVQFNSSVRDDAFQR